MNTRLTALLIALSSLLFCPAANCGEKSINNPGPDAGKTQYLRSVAADCLPASASAELNIGGVRARINNGGDMWWDLIGVAQYEVPKGSGRNALFAGALWVSGTDQNGNIKVAAQRYRSFGNDFWPGPLTIDGMATTDAGVCQDYNFISTIYRQDVIDFVNYFENPSLFPGYSIPAYFFEYPAHGNSSLGQSHYLAPFFDYNEDGEYDPNSGDYPYYDLNNNLCHQPDPTAEDVNGTTTGGVLFDQALKGDQTLWWVFNDMGNTHTETGGSAIGIEVRAQAFAFATGDEINNMTFYSYEVINRSNQTLYDAHIGMYIDISNGGNYDDLIGCDVPRGLGYAYGGDDFDESFNGEWGYGNQPAAVGIDFLKGPYLDPDGIDNGAFVQHTDSSGMLWFENCNAAVNGSNFGNGIIDDECYGMNYFVKTIEGQNIPILFPEDAHDYYNNMRALWNNNTHMIYGGNGHPALEGYGPECNYMFPGESDICDYGTGGIPPYGPKKWTEETAGNFPGDRRVIQSAGPFTMQPGEVNYLTVGVPWARAGAGGAAASLELLKYADDKCQVLFDNCFRLLYGPDAPDISAQELDREVILYLSNHVTSNNYQDKFEEVDPSIVSPSGYSYDSLYRFEGYQVFQVTDPNVTSADVYDPDKARLVAQCDIDNDASTLVNYIFSQEMGLVVPQTEVEGANEGIVHSFRILDDMFASGENQRLVNHKKYYYMVLAYAHNEYEKYSADPATQFPGIMSSNGQKNPYLSGRKNIDVYTAIPHAPAPESGGTIINGTYGAQPVITRIEGQGNGGNILELNSASRQKIMEDGFSEELTYEAGFGPVTVKVIDPLNVKEANYILKLDSTNASWLGEVDSYSWILEEYDMNDNFVAAWYSDHDISSPFEQIFTDLGIAVCFTNGKNPGDLSHESNGFLYADIIYSDPSNNWLGGVSDADGPTAYNWIRSGTQDSENSMYDDHVYYGQYIDPLQYYEKVIAGTWAPYRLCSYEDNNPALMSIAPFLSTANKMSNLASIDVVLTPDKSMWTRCPVLETCDDELLAQGNARKLTLRHHASVDKNGNTLTAEAIYDGHEQGMGWFPGYAINVETGERLNIAFGEDSWLGSENGNDMMFNPTSNLETTLGEPLLGGKHFVYVFGHLNDDVTSCSAYDEGTWLYYMIGQESGTALRNAFASALWCSIPLSVDGEQWLGNECRVRIRVSKEYAKNYSTFGSASPQNGNYPMYSFNTSSLMTVTNDPTTATNALDMINVVPNPYYALDDYEESVYENKIKITNVPSKCTVTIFNLNGTIVRKFENDDPDKTSIEWDLRNTAGKIVSGGVYIIHVYAPGIGERSIRWFGSMKTVVTNEF
ncbi:MAG: hypothetical protein A2W93_08620 [Bacteroidetes bacterium GWF2_43_63]|nr:MAG: hypothetical protein A2W93_08620 [Bacteroidetes bacterium GWF2_43_63]HCY23010.1 T9SS C-terminal target domain-containing protein [Bacteroidales bacterium]